MIRIAHQSRNLEKGVIDTINEMRMSQPFPGKNILIIWSGLWFKLGSRLGVRLGLGLGRGLRRANNLQYISSIFWGCSFEE